MTIALAMRCIDGIVLCADSLETDGVTKRLVDKMWVYEVQDQGRQEWGLAIASAGEADLIDSFNDDLKEVLGNSDFDELKLLAKLRTAIRAVRVSYPEAEFGFLAVAYGNPKLYRKIFRVMDRSSHLGPVTRYQAIGIGAGLANYLASKIYRPSMCIAEAIRLGVFILSQVKIHTEGCDGPTSIVTFGGIGNNHSQFRVWNQSEISDIEAELSDEKFCESIEAFWRSNNAPLTFSSAKAKEGGSARRIIVAKLNTQS